MKLGLKFIPFIFILFTIISFTAILADAGTITYGYVRGNMDVPTSPEAGNWTTYGYVRGNLSVYIENNPNYVNYGSAEGEWFIIQPNVPWEGSQAEWVMMLIYSMIIWIPPLLINRFIPIYGIPAGLFLMAIVMIIVEPLFLMPFGIILGGIIAMLYGGE